MGGKARRRRAAAVLTALFLAAAGRGALADYDDAVRAYERGDYAVAVKVLEPLVKQGSPSAQHLLGLMREQGRGGPANPAEAAELYRKAARGGNVPAMVRLGTLLMDGRGVARNDVEADAAFRQAAAKGSSEALYGLGLMRLAGRGGPKYEAAGYLRKAAGQGYLPARLALAELALAGRDMPKDPAEAFTQAQLGLVGKGVSEADRKRLAGLAEKAEKELGPVAAGALRRKLNLTTAAAEAPKPSASGLRTGTGFVVSREGYVLTNAHVAGGCGHLLAGLDGRLVPIALVSLDRDNDLALLKLPEGRSKFLMLRDDPPKAGEAVFAVGYPLGAALRNQLHVTSGQVRDLAKAMSPMSGAVATSAQVRPGNSGGPLLDDAGHVAGVVKAMRNPRWYEARIGDAPSEMGFAVSLDVVRRLLDAGHVHYLNCQPTRRLDAKAIEAAAAGTVLPLFCVNGPGH